jgi:regulator of protease activity HflC (stomatin/prohibitin superfamily)
VKTNQGWLAATLVVASALSLGGCTHEVPPASVGIRFNASSGISEKLLKPQVLWLGPRDRLIVYPTSIRNATYTRNANEGERMGDDSIQASTAEGSTLPVDITISYHVDPDNVVKAFENFGTADLHQIQTDYIRWATIYSVNVVSGRHSIFDLTSKDRAGFGPEVKAELAPILGSWGITVDDVYLGEVYPNEEVRSKVNERINMKNGLELAKVSLQRAQIDSQTILTNAKKDASLNALLAEQGEKSLELKKLELQRQAIAKWDGKPPIIGGSSIPFTDIDIK